MTLTLILFVAGFIFLLKGADLLVDGASALAKKIGVSSLFIGLTIVAFGTSAPELTVNVFSSLAGKSDIAIGNVLGSNIANILLILGISAAIYPLTLSRGTIWKEIPFALLAVLVLGLMANDALIDNVGYSLVTRIDGLILLGFFIIFLYYAFSISKQGEEEIVHPHEIKPASAPKSLALIFLGLAGLIIGGKWIVDGAVALARSFNISESLIALTIIAVGTSLPELATSAVAAYKKKSDIAVGNIVGSNIFNIFFVLGISAVINPIVFKSELVGDIFAVLAATVLLFAATFVGKKNTIDRSQGIVFVLLYIIYLVYLILRQ